MNHFLVALLASVAPSAWPGEPLPTPRYPRVQQPFAAGLATVRRSLPPAGKNDEATRRIRELLDFHDRRVAWGELVSVAADGARTYLVQNEPKDPTATIIVSFEAKVPEEFNLRTEGTRLWVYEYPTTSAWAGVMLLHELGHLDEAVRSVAPQDNAAWLADELRAYEVELKAADLISKGSVTAALRRFIAGMKSRDPAAFFDEFQSVAPERYDGLKAELETAMRSGRPKSDTESNLRYGFAMASVGLVRFGPDRKAQLRWMEVLTRSHGTEEMKERLAPVTKSKSR